MDPTAPTVAPNIHLHERSIVIPESTFLRLERCYYGVGPNAFGHVFERPTSETPTTGGGTEGKLNPLPVTIREAPFRGMAPRGVAPGARQTVAATEPRPGN